jgi:adenylate cyclase
MAFEIERKFLVRSEAWRNIATAQASIRQAYLASGERSTTRVRIKNESEAMVTIKSKRAELRRLEVEYPISVLDAEALMSLRHSGLIEKTRFTVPWQRHAWEVDVFAGENAGLVIAEIELRHEDETFDRPPWLGVERPIPILQWVLGTKPIQPVVDIQLGSRRELMLRAVAV